MLVKKCKAPYTKYGHGTQGQKPSWRKYGWQSWILLLPKEHSHKTKSTINLKFVPPKIYRSPSFKEVSYIPILFTKSYNAKYTGQEYWTVYNAKAKSLNVWEIAINTGGRKGTTMYCLKHWYDTYITYSQTFYLLS